MVFYRSFSFQMVKGYQQVPAFNGNFAQFEREVKLWCSVSLLKTPEQGVALALSLSGTARIKATTIPEDELKAENGLERVLREIKSLFEKDSVDAKYKVLKELEEFVRPDDQSIMQYIIMFELKLRTAEDVSGGNPYSDAMQAYKLICGARLSETDERIVRSSCKEYKYEEAVQALKRIFGNASYSGSEISGGAIGDSMTRMTIKEEPTFYGQGGKYNNKNSGTPYWKRKSFSKRCWICNSEDHLRDKCPQYKGDNGNNRSNYQNKQFKRDKIHHVNNDDFDRINYAENHALLDCGASRNVVGRKWLDYYKGNLEKDMLSMFEIFTEERTFVFGDKAHIGMKMKLPLNIHDRQYIIEVFVVDIDVPLLLSTKSMKDLKMKINFETDTAEIDGDVVDLIVTENGHYLIPVVSEHVCFTEEEIHFTPIKLHRAFGHASADRIIQVLKQSDNYDVSLDKDLRKIEKNCEFCNRYRRRVADPSVSIGISENFNDLVCVDLKFLKEDDGTMTIILHMIDHLTKFSMAKVVKNKTGQEITEAILMKWISIFGPPKAILSDNGSEFINIDFNEMCDLLNIKHKTTAAYSPVSNGVVERHNGILASMMKKVKEDLQVSNDVALSWAIQAKNSLLNKDGFSPYQQVFGYNPKIPQVSTSTDMALREKTPSTIVRQMLNTLHRSREEYVKAECNSKLKRVSRCKMENASCEMFKTDDEVFFRRRIDKEWIGPVKVVGQLNKTVVVIHGGQLIKIHCQSVRRKVNNADCMLDKQSTSVESSSDVQKNRQCDEREEEQCEEDDDDDEEQNEDEEEQNVDEVDDEDDGQQNEEEHVNDEEEIEEDGWIDIEKDRTGKMRLKDGDKIRYELDGEKKEATITSRSGKASGAYKNRFNLIDEEDVEFRLDLDEVSTIEKSSVSVEDVALVSDPVKGLTEETADDIRGDLEKAVYYGDIQVTEEVVHFLEDSVWAVMVPKSRFNEPDIAKAMVEELDTFANFKTFEEVKDIGQDCLSMRWIITEKTLDSGKKKFKARLVCRGFEEEDSQFESDSPTVEKTSVRIFLSLTSIFGWNLNALDIKAAFLQAEKIDREVFVRPPKSIKRAGTIWHLLKPLYGLADSCRNWYFTLRNALIDLGFVCSQEDKALFYMRTDDLVLDGILIIHVDDILFSGNGKFLKIMKQVSQRFKISRSESGSCRYVGLDITGYDKGIQLTQKDYCNLVKPVVITTDRKLQLEEKVSSEELKDYQSLLGKLNWLSCNSRPDLKFDVFWFSLFGKNPTVQQLVKLNSVASRVGKGPICIVFPKLNSKQLRLVMYSDASLGNLEDKVKSCKAYILFLADDECCAAVSWNCKKIDRVCTSTLEAEARALKYGVQNAIATRHMIKGILKFEIPIYCMIDSKQLLNACYSTKNVSDPVLKRDVALLQQWLNKGVISHIDHVKSAEQLADVLTKRGVNPLKLSTVLETGRLPVIDRV